MATKIYDHITIDGDDAKLDASLIENLDNNQEFAALKEDLSDLKQSLTQFPIIFNLDN